MVEHMQTKLVPEKTARWAIEEYRVYNIHSGVTTNMAEGFNTVMKRFLKWKEVPLDLLIHSLQELQTYYANEIQRAMCGIGQYHLLQVKNLVTTSVLLMSVLVFPHAALMT